MTEEIEILDVEEDIYKEYVNQLSSFNKLTTDDNSLFFEFKVKNKRCYSKIVKFSHDSSENVLKEKEFPYDEEFKNEILEPVIRNYIKNNQVVINDVAPLDDDQATFRIITGNNDTVVISGIEIGYAKKLSDITIQLRKELKGYSSNDTVVYQEANSQQGIGSSAALILLLAIIGIVFIILISINLIK